MRWRSALILLLPFAGLIAALAAVTRGISLGPATALVERQLSRAIERPVTLAQAPQLKLGRVVTIDVPSLAIGNAAWAGSEPLLRARDLHASVMIGSLIRGPITVSAFRANDLVLNLEIAEDGQSNLPGGTTDVDAASDTEQPFEASGFTLPLTLESAELGNINIHYNDRRDNRPILLHADRLIQSSSSASGLLLEGNGHLQGADWTLSVTSTAMQSIATQLPFSAHVSGTLATLSLVGSAQLPKLQSLQDLTLQMNIEGTLPAKITELSPLLRPDTPLNMSIVATDIDPGIGMDVNVQLPNIAFRASGDIQDPGAGDGFSLDLSADAANIQPLARALRLGNVADMPLTLNGHIDRDGRRISISQLSVLAGEHRWNGELLFPDFPNTKGARVKLTGTGPDLAFYQRLLHRPVSVELPYDTTLSLRGGDSGLEVAESLIKIGTHEVSVQGPVGDFPSFRGSDLRVRMTGPDANNISKAFGVTLPNQPYQLDGRVAVAQSGGIQLESLSVEMGSLNVNASGAIGGYPDFDNLMLSFDISTASLADTSTTWGLQRLGDLPATVSGKVSGGLYAVQVDNIDLQAGGLSIRSETGALRFADGKLSSDIKLLLNLSEQRQLLGEYAVEQMQNIPVSLRLTPQFSESTIDLAITDIQAQGIRGNAALRIGRDLRLDKHSYLNADLTVDNASRIIPVTKHYQAPASPIAVSARTTRTQDQTRIKTVLTGQDNATLTVSADIPDDPKAPRQITIRGAGDDTATLGKLGSLPDKALPFSIDADILLHDKDTRVTLRQLSIGGSSARGVAALNTDARTLTASINIPGATLDQWISSADDTQAQRADERPKPADRSEQRLIPDYPLPLAWLNDYVLAIELQTGPLGLADPDAPSLSMVDYLKAEWNSDNGKATLILEELRGSRGSATGRLEINIIDDNAATVETTLAVREFPGGGKVSSKGLDSLPRLSMDANLAASGGSTRELAKTLSGDLLVSGGPGRFKDAGLSFATESFLSQLISTLLPTIEGESDNKVECSLIAATADNGVVTLDPGLVFRGERVDLLATGDIDLASEKIRIRFNNKARKGLGVSAAGLVNPYVQITGTLAKPKLSLDVKGSAIAGGTAAATGGLSVVAKTFFDRFLDTRNPCETALTAWQERTR